MKYSHSYLFVYFGVLFLITSCKDKFTKTYEANSPIYLDYTEWRNQEFSVQESKQIKSVGKMWIKDQYLFINDPMQGVHIFDNSNPSNPINLGFLPILSSLDIAIKENVLFVDSYTDLLSFDITDPNNIQFLCRTTDVFNANKAQTPLGYNENLPAVNIDVTKGVIVGWEQEQVTEDVYYGGVFLTNLYTNDIAPTSELFSNTNIGGVSMGGSMASFAIHSDFLYVIEGNNIITFQITNNCLQQVNTQQTSRRLETFFIAEDYLYVGTTTGMLIYNLQNNNPVIAGIYQHVGSCDPVVVQGDRAYVTLRTGTPCAGNVNQLVVVDIANKSNPTEIKTYEMTNPHGLGLDENTLFLCDGSDGLKVFDKSNDFTIDQNMISHFQNINTFDVIPYNNTLIMTAKEGIYQYNYSDLQNITQLSLIPIN